MTYHDISGKLELTSTSNQKEITEHLLASFHSLEIDSEIEWGDGITFKIPLLKTLMRGSAFQGISSGSIKVERSEEANALHLEYKLDTLPMRLGIIVMLLWVLIGMPTIIFSQNEGFNFPSYIPFQLTAVIFVGFAFLMGRFFTKNNFVTFIRRSLIGKAAVIRRPIFGRKLNFKKIGIFSCSGIFFLVLLIPATMVFGVINLQSKVVWRSPIQNIVMSAPVISDGTLYFGTIKDIDPAAFYALDSSSGEQLWTKPLGGVVMNSPVLTEDSVCFGLNDGFFYCLDRENGRELWEFSPEQRNLDSATCDSCALLFNTPIIENSVIYLSSHDNNVYALNAQTGHINWVFPTGGAIMDAPAIVDGTIYVGSYDGYVYLLDSATGQEVRRYFVSSPSPMDSGYYSGVIATPLIDTTTIYAINGPFKAIDIQSGEVKWQAFDASSYKDQITGSPFFFEDLIIVTTNNAIYAIDKTSGEIRWRYSDIKGSVYFTPTLHEEVIYFGGSSGYLYGIQAETGKKVFRYNLKYLDPLSYTNFFGDILFPPGVDEQKIYVKWFNHFYAIQK